MVKEPNPSPRERAMKQAKAEVRVVNGIGHTPKPPNLRKRPLKRRVFK